METPSSPRKTTLVENRAIGNGCFRNYIWFEDTNIQVENSSKQVFSIIASEKQSPCETNPNRIKLRVLEIKMKYLYGNGNTNNLLENMKPGFYLQFLQ